ncbi:hypothetical protein [Mesorhizobium sp. M0435]|uniref:hypothetical protein n=1 Tax=Mesorhizobium sp. M0435 TaxID=2956944 RepID=UPI00333583F5
MEQDIALLTVRIAKLEFYLLTISSKFAQLDAGGKRIIGFDWQRVGREIENCVPFATFDFANSGFAILRDTAPQFLTVTNDGNLHWDSDDHPIDSWERLMDRSFAQLRNNLAHGSKHRPAAPFTHGRTVDFLKAGHAIIDFVARSVLRKPDWEKPLGYW